MNTIIEALSTTIQVKLVRKKHLIATALDPDNKIFKIYIVFIANLDLIQPYFRAQIPPLKANETLITILFKYTDFVDHFSPDLVAKLSKHTKINDHIIEFIDGKQLFYSQIYSLGSIRLETLKTNIKTNLANSFIRSSKILADAMILFI